MLALVIAANARNALLQEAALKAASDRFETQELGHASKMSEHGITRPDHQKEAVSVARGIDQGNKFIAQTVSGVGAVYDPMRRIVKIVETRNGSITSTKQFVWAGDQLAEERDASGNVTRRFFSMGEQISGTNYYYTRDHIGSVREMTNSAGTVQSQYSYGPFGETSKLAGSGPDSDMQFTGLYMHQPSGLNLTVNRAYGAAQGRFLSRDPIGEAAFSLAPNEPEPTVLNPLVQQTARIASTEPIIQTGPQANLYAYVANNPISRTDRSGLGPLTPIQSIGAIDLCPTNRCIEACSKDPFVSFTGVFDKCLRDCINSFQKDPEKTGWPEPKNRGFMPFNPNNPVNPFGPSPGPAPSPEEK